MELTKAIKKIFTRTLITCSGVLIFIVPTTNGYISFGIEQFLDTVKKAISICLNQVSLVGTNAIQAVGVLAIFSFLMLVFMSQFKEPKYPKKEGKVTGKLKAGSLIED